MYGTSVLYSRVVRCSFRSYSNSSKKLLEFLADMPKSHKERITSTQRQRLNVNKKVDKYPPSNVYLQVLGSGARGAPNTVYLFTDHKRYLFNCGECTQRLAHEHKVKLSKLDHIFITGKSWKNIGGLPGLSLTLQDVGVPNITLHGPEGLDELYKATKRFVIMKEMSVTMAKCSKNEDFSDNAISVKYIELGPHESLLKGKPPTKKQKLDNQDKEFEKFEHDNTDYYRRENSNLGPQSRERVKHDRTRKSPSPEPKKLAALENLNKRSNSTLAYVVTLKKRMGTLDLAKCVECGVPPGPLLGQLKAGRDVILSDGTLVMSADVKTPDDPGPVFIVLEVPDISYLKESEFQSHFDNGHNPPENIPTVVVHLTPPQVFNDPIYQSFMAHFGAKTRHMLLNDQNSCLGSEAVHRTQHKLHLLDPDIFPMLKDASVPAVWSSHPAPTEDSPVRRGLEDLKNKIAHAQFQNIINLEGSKGEGISPNEPDSRGKIEAITGRTLTMFHLRPKKDLDRSAEPKLHIQDYIQESMDVDGFVDSLEQFRRLVDGAGYKSHAHEEFPKVLFLGTGSCIPSKTRNTSGIALQIDENKTMILDCGEGTFGQIVRFFGTKKVDAFLMTIKAIYVSHLHADHHIGLIGLLQARREAFVSAGLPAEPVYLLAPGQIYTWLSLYDQQFERIKTHFTLIPNQNLVNDAQHTDMNSAILSAIGVQNIETCYVSHCPNAFGVAVQVDGHKVTYSGDTIPCPALAQIGADSTLLIHEATMEDELADEARVKMHSTTSQAIDMGKQMNAHYTVLTHFSQRYARLPRLNAHILNDNKSVGIAFDNMQITMNDLKILPHMYAPLQMMFAEHCIEMELKAAHRAKHKAKLSKTPSSGYGSECQTKFSQNNTTTNPSRSRKPIVYRDSNSSRLRIEKKAKEKREQAELIVKVAKARPRSHSSPARRTPNSPRSLNSDVIITHIHEAGKNSQVSMSSLNSSMISKDLQEDDNFASAVLSLNHNGSISTGTSIASKASSRNGNLSTDFLPDNTDSVNGYEKQLFTLVNNKTKNCSNRNNNILNESMKDQKRLSTTNGRSRNMAPNNALKADKPFLMQEKAPKWVYSSKFPAKVTASENVRAPATSCDQLRYRPHAGEDLPAGNKAQRPRTATICKTKTYTGEFETLHKPTRRIFSKDSMASHKSRTPTAEPKVIVNARVASPQRKPSKIPLKERSSLNLRLQSERIAEKLRPSVENLPPEMNKMAVKPDLSNTSKKQNIPKMSDKLKQQFCRDTPPMVQQGRAQYYTHNKSYKPQLEDIKSSFLLLQKQKMDISSPRSASFESEIKINNNPCTPKPINETQRKKMLIDTMQRFRSREFKANARYDKIEGLNWVTWNNM